SVNQTANRAYSGIAQIAAMAAIPAPAAGKNYSIGMGGGFYAGQQAIAFGGKATIAENFSVGASFGTGFGSTSSMAASVGAGYSF
ncbi:MAG: YadA-like family protein, partial [Methylococcaceae bacterium]